MTVCGLPATMKNETPSDLKMKMLDVEEQRTLLLLQAHYPVSDVETASILCRIFSNTRHLFASQPRTLARLLARSTHDSLNLQTHIMRRNLHDDSDEEIAWNTELLGDVEAVANDLNIKPYEAKARPIDLRALPPCSHQHAFNLAAFD